MTLDQLAVQLEDAERALSDPDLTAAERDELGAAIEYGNCVFVEVVASESGLPLFMRLLADEIARDTPDTIPEEWQR